MPNTLYLHVGSPKTATTLVQRHFTRSGVLAAHGVHYPVVGDDPRDYAQHAFGRALLHADYGSASTIVSRATAGHASTLLSAETITNCIASPRRFPGFLQFLHAIAGTLDAVRVIVFLREASTFYESMYLQSMKGKELATSFDAYLSQRQGWFGTLFRNLSAIESIGGNVVLDAHAFRPGSYAEEWRRALGFDIALPASTQANPRLSLKSHLFFRQFEAFRSQRGVAMERREALELMGLHPSPFDDDQDRFRLYRDGVAEAIHAHALAEAERCSRHEYLLAFAGHAPLQADIPWVDLDAVALTPRDLDAAEAFLRAHATTG
ncbi:MAG: hypothetical protein QM719_05110 [Thermomonas sp.]